MIGRVAACLIGSSMILLGACNDPIEVPDTAHLVASTTFVTVPPTLSTRTPSTAPTTVLTATTTTVPTTTTVVIPTTTTMTTTTTIIVETDRLYRMHERSAEIVELQLLLGLESVDGIYGPITRKAHIDYLGGPLVALTVFYPNLAEPVASSDTTLSELITRHFLPADRVWAQQVAFCESSAHPHHTESTVVSSALAIGWFQHLAKYWEERSVKAGVPGANPFDTEANVTVAAWLFYEGGGARHWNPSRTCWEKE